MNMAVMGKKVLEVAESTAKVPDVVAGVDEVEGSVEGNHAEVARARLTMK